MYYYRVFTAMYNAEFAQLSASPKVVATAFSSDGAGSKIPKCTHRLGRTFERQHGRSRHLVWHPAASEHQWLRLHMCC